MRGTNRAIRVLLAVGLVLALEACAEGPVDDGDSPNVVLVISKWESMAITTKDEEGSCVFVVPESVPVSLANVAKTTLAVSPMSDVVLDSVWLTYTWDDGRIDGPMMQAVAGLVPCGGSVSVGVLPMLLGDLSVDRAGHSATVEAVFRGKLVDGNSIESLPGPPGGVMLSVFNTCF